MPIDPNRVQAVFLAAVELPDIADRAALLDRECGSDLALRQRVESLLRAHDVPDSLEEPTDGPTTFHDPTPVDVGSIHVARPPTEAVGTRIGPYRLLQQIGEGGMGVVFVAEQERPVKRRVALKVIKPGMDTNQVVARFEAERQALAMMDHPNIAKVLDAGATDAGRPYFVMELVKGVPITDYCDTVHLTPRERLELFIPVCAAIQHAHQKGIIHRDIKPSNVLVTMQDGKAVPKVIDFGIAKAIDQRLTERSLFTDHGAIVGTLEYMSPEQAEMSAMDVDTRTDVYALGVLLYELLTGTTPLERARLRLAGYAEILKRIREEEPETPSSRVRHGGSSGSGATTVRDGVSPELSSIAAARRTEPARLTKLIRGDLDWIVMKALEKDRTRRYETANGFARDIQRHLDGDAVEACPPSTRYKLGKFARKHRAALATVAAFAFLLVASTAISSWLTYRATHAERLARQRLTRAETAEAEARANAESARTQQARAETREEQAINAVKRFRDAVADNPELKNNPALEPLRKTLLKEPLAFFKALRDRLQADRDTRPYSLDRLAHASFDLGNLSDEIGDKQDALIAHREALAIRQALAEAKPAATEFRRDLAASHNNMGRLLRETGKPAEALEAYKAALAINQALADANPAATKSRRDLAASHLNIGLLLRDAGKPVEALKAHEAALAIRQALAEANPTVTRFRSDVALSHGNIGVVLNEIGKPAEALKALQAALAIWQPLADANPTVTRFRRELALSHANIGNALSTIGKPAEALKAHEAALAILEQLAREPTEFPFHASVLGAMLDNVAKIDYQAGRFGAARERLLRAIVWQKKALAANPRSPQYRNFLTHHLNSLIQAARGLGDAKGVAEAERELAKLRDSDPAMAALDAWLSAILEGDQQPKDNAERLPLAQRAYDKALHATAARLWGDTIEADPKLGDDRQAQHRYNAACAAALAGSGQGKDDPKPDEVARAKLRAQALGWLKAELSAWKKVAMTVAPGNKELVASTLAHWKGDGDLAGIRDAPGLAGLPEEERDAFGQLWGEVDALLAKVSGGK